MMRRPPPPAQDSTLYPATPPYLYCVSIHASRAGGDDGVNKYDDDVIGAGLTIQASLQIGEGPQKIIPPVTGWRAKQEDASGREKAWAA